MLGRDKFLHFMGWKDPPDSGAARWKQLERADQSGRTGRTDWADRLGGLNGLGGVGGLDHMCGLGQL